MGTWIDDIATALLRASLPTTFGPTQISDGAGGTVLDYSSAVARVAVCRVATTAAMPAFTRSLNTITASANGVLAAIDGISLSVGDIFLVKDEGGADVDHGPYQLTATGGATTPWTADRAPWFNDMHNALPGTVLVCVEGTANARTLFVCTTASITLNTTALEFEKAGADISPGGITASSVSFSPNGDIAATDVQAAIVELRDDTDTKLSTITIPSPAYTPTNVSTDRAYNANSTTLDELADVLGTVIADLQTAGILG